MREMKDSGVEWIGEIPADWQVRKIKHLATLAGRIGWQGLTSNEYSDEGVYLITGVNFYNGKIDWQSCVHVPEYRWEEAKQIQIKNGDLLITKDGTIGKVAIVENMPGKTSLNSGVLLVRNNDECDTRFLYWMIQSDIFWRWFGIINAGNSTILHLYQQSFYNFSFPFPLLSQQKKIVEFLDSNCKKIDEIIEKQKAVIEKLGEYKLSIINEAVTQGINPDVNMKQSGYKWIGSIPEQWNMVYAKQLFSQRKDRAFEDDEQLTASQKYGIISQKEFMDIEGRQVMQVLKGEEILKHVEKGDFVISMRSFQGGLEYSEVSGKISSAYVMLIPNRDKVYNRYYKWLFKSKKYISALQGTSNLIRDGQALRFSNFVQVYLPSLDLDEQKQIADYLDDVCPKIDNEIGKREKLLEKVLEYKKSLIYEVVTGKKEV
ncbi:type I restriction-modification system, specificity subunit S [Lachnospiraceae bacterium KM106-2]|nr:type I restriction-modification system, specificity subunit S [Lachnospiraceae bacterium KM106-2]